MDAGIRRGKITKSANADLHVSAKLYGHIKLYAFCEYNNANNGYNLKFS